MNNKKIPIIKENRIEKIKKCLECVDAYAFNRDKQRDCVLNLYKDKKEKSIEHRDKSIFRGMVIPSLRYLGLIMGYGNFIRVSANGKLMIESQLIDQDLHNRVLRAVIYEIDENVFHFINIIGNSYSLLLQDFLNYLYNRVDAPSEKQKKERISRWLSILEEVELVKRQTQMISINKENFNQAIKDLNINFKNPVAFKRYFLEVYFKLGKGSAGVVDIADLRREVAIEMLQENKIILTEKQFDAMLRNILQENQEYVISLGKPMGAQEKLFEYKGNYFRTIFIKTRKAVEK